MREARVMYVSELVLHKLKALVIDLVYLMSRFEDGALWGVQEK